MKEIVVGALNELRLDLKEIAYRRFEADDDDQHTFEALAIRVANINELVGHYFELANESAKNAARWKFLFQTSGISFKMEGGNFHIMKDVVVDGKITGQRMLTSGATLPIAVDSFLGF